jgi:tellurite resistance protein TerC
MLLALIAIELADIMFAVDSVPAALSVTRNRFVVYSSNIFAILGLRALYILMAATIVRLRYMHYALAGVLAFAAFKIATQDWIPIHPIVSIAIIAGLIAAAVWASLRADGREALEEPARG